MSEQIRGPTPTSQLTQLSAENAARNKVGLRQSHTALESCVGVIED